MRLNPDDLIVTSFGTASAAGDGDMAHLPGPPTPGTGCGWCPPELTSDP